MSARVLRPIAAGAVALTCCAALLGLAAPAPAAPPTGRAVAAAAPVDVQLLSLTDFHGYIRPHTDTGNGTVPGPDGPIVVGGAPYLATHWKQLAWPENSVQFAVGDTFSGWPTEVAFHADEPTIEFLNYLGLDFETVGNHELDISKSFLIDHMWRGECFGKVNVDSCFTNSAGKRFSGSTFGYSTANIVDPAKNNQPIVPPYVIKYVEGANGRRVPVGIINLTTDTTVEGSTSYQPGLEDLPLVETANAYAAKLQRMGVQTIVVSAHEGLSAGGQYWTCNGNPSGPMADFARAASPAIDVIVTGHWHTQFNCTIPDPAGNPRPVVEAGFHGKLINEIQLKIDPRTKDVIRSETKAVNHPVTRDVAPDPKAARLVDYWVERGDRTYARDVAAITGTIDRTADATGQSTLGNLTADALYEDSQRVNRKGRPADLALVVTKPHSGSTALRGDLSYAAGPNPADRDGRVLFGEAWAAFGYANPVLTATVSGQQIHDALEGQWRAQADGPSRAAAHKKPPEVSSNAGAAAVKLSTAARDIESTERFAPFAVSSNVKYGYDPSRPIGDRVDPAKVLIDGRPLDVARDYRLAALAYTLIGGDGTTAFTGKIRDEVRGTRDYEAFRGYLTRHSPLAPPALDRIIRE